MAVYYIGSQPFGYNDLSHHGILGMKWGIRRYQNPDGTLTPEGKARYHKLYGVDDHKPDFIERGFGRKIKQYESIYEGERKALNKSLAEGKQSRAKRHYTNMIGFEIARRSEKKAFDNYQKLSDQEKKAIKGSIVVSNIIAGVGSASMIGIASASASPVAIGSAFIGSMLAEIGNQIFVTEKLWTLHEDNIEELL